MKGIVLLLSAALLTSGVRLEAAEFGGMNVIVSVEGYDRRLAKGCVSAYTFEDALKALAVEDGIDIVFGHDGSKTYVYSVGGTAENKFGAGDGWFGYVRRQGGLIKPPDYLSFLLEQGDEVVLYYGSKDDTKIVSGLDLTASSNNITFAACTEKTGWFWKNGKWIVSSVPDPLAGVKIRIRQPDGNMRILKTNESGLASTMFGEPGVYEYFAEGYVNGSFPAVARSRDQMYLHGIEDACRVTRAEAAAFIVNGFNVTGGGGPVTFTDVDSSVKNNREIMRGASAGLLHGFGDGSFRPDEPVTLAQLAVMLSGLADTPFEPYSEGDVPQWAANGVGAANASGLLEGVRGDWNGSVTAEMLTRVFVNMK